MRLRALFVLLVVAFSASDVGAQIGDATGLIPPRAAVPADNADLRTDDQINGSSWQINARLPEPRGSSQGATVASSDGSLIYSVGGGCCHSDYPDGINRLWAYSPKDDSWSAAADVPVSDGIRAYGSAVELNGFIYVFGGVAGPASNPRMLNTTWIYDEANDGWFEGANMPDFRAGSAVGTDGAVIWVIGGFKSLGFFDTTNTVWIYDPSTDVYSTGFRDMPQYLGRIHGVMLADRTLHVLGGHWDMNDHWVYDTSADAWSSAPLIPSQVLDPAVATDGTLIYVGGANLDPPRGDGHTQIYDPATHVWSEGPRMPAPALNNTSGTIANGTFYVVGGYDGVAPSSVNYSLSLSGLGRSNR